METQSQSPDLAAIKDRQQKTWAAGNVARVGNRLVIVGELLCEAVDVHAGQKVPRRRDRQRKHRPLRREPLVRGDRHRLCARADRGGKDARRGRTARGELRGGRRRESTLSRRFLRRGALTVGVMFAPDQERAAGELLRVCHPRGWIGLANRTPDGWAGEFFRIVGRNVPPPPGLKPPPLWGTEERLRKLFGEEVSSLEMVRRTHILRYRSAGHFVEHYRSYFEPMQKAFQSLDAEGQDGLEQDLEEFLDRWNISGDQTTAVPSDYLEVVATRR